MDPADEVSNCSMNFGRTILRQSALDCGRLGDHNWIQSNSSDQEGYRTWYQKMSEDV